MQKSDNKSEKNIKKFWYVNIFSYLCYTEI